MALKRRWAAYGAAIASVLSTVAAAPAAATPIAPPSLVDGGVFPYPDAAAILAEQNVELISGDGHIVLADCSTPPVGDIGLMKVFTTDETIGADGIGRVCFRVTASSGVLNLRVPGVYEIRGDGQRTGTGHQVTAELHSDDGDDLTVPIDPDGSTQVGLGADPNASPTMLLQLHLGTGPAPVTGSQAAIGKVASADRMCTATLVAPRWILTGASCFSADPNQVQLLEGAPTGTFHAVFPQHPVRTVDWLSTRRGRDVVLARLTTPIEDITPMALAASAPTGVALTAIGYGRTPTDLVADQQRSIPITFSADTSTTLTASSGPLVCSGMAGAPVLNGGAVSAVLSTAGQAGCPDTAGADTSVAAARTDDLATWLEAVTTTTADHTWTLADMPADASSGTNVTTTDDVVHSGVASPLTASYGATWNTGDLFSPDISFNGGQSLRAVVPPINTTTDFTFSAWVKASAAGGVVFAQNGRYKTSANIKAEAADNSWQFKMADVDSLGGTFTVASAGPNSVQFGMWTHLTATYAAATGQMTLYVNGVSAATATKTNPYNGSAGFTLGAAYLCLTVKCAGSSYFSGQMAYVQTWNSVVPPTA